LYDPNTGKRTWLENLDKRWGVVLHMPAGVGTAELRWLNLEHGWLGAQLAGPVRRWRTVNHADLMRPLLPPEPRQVPEGKCAGRKRDGEPCTFKAVRDGYCNRHADQQGEDPDAPVNGRTRAVAAELREALEHVPEPLRQPATAVDPGTFAGTEQAQADAEAQLEETAEADPFVGITTTDAAEDESTAVKPAVDDPITWCDCRSDEQCPPGELCRRRSHLPDPRQPLPLTSAPAGELNGNPRPHTSMPTPEDAAEAAQKAEMALMDQVRACRTTGELDVLWQTTGQAWTDAVKKYAKRHRDLLPELTQQQKAGAALLVAIRSAGNGNELLRLFEDPRNAELITDEHKAAARERAAQVPPF
jgi:hypothetical protein